MSAPKRRLSEEAERVNPIQPVHIWRTPAGSAVDMLIVTHLQAYSVIHSHSVAALPNETGGFLIGRVSCDSRDGCWHIEVEEAIPVAPESQDPVHFTFTWRDVDRVRAYREGQRKALVGWFHTHPNLDIFLSDTDLDRTHRVLFTEPFQIALVYDPTRGRAGYFYWEGTQQIDASAAEWREFDIVVEDIVVEEAEPRQPSTSDEAPSSTSAAASDTPPIDSVTTAEVAPGAPVKHAPSLTNPGASAAGMADVATTGVVPGTPEAAPRRVRAVPVDSDAETRSVTPTATPVGTSAAATTAAAPEAPDGRRLRRSPWLFLFGLLMVVAGGAVGYFWLFAAKGAQ